MAVTPTPVLPQTPRHAAIQISTGTGVALVTLINGGVNGTKITSVIASNGDSTANSIQWGVTVASSLFYLAATASMAANSGSSQATPTTNLFSATYVPGLPIDNDGQNYIFLNSTSESIQVKVLTTISSAAAVISVHAFGADF